MNNGLSADYVVVGSGAGGAPLAARLALAGFDVLVLEAGTDHGDSLVYQVPAFHGRASEDPAMSWAFFVQHYANADRQSVTYDPKYDEQAGGIFYPRAATLGGCTAHNAMITIYPHSSDWKYLEEITGDPTWGPGPMRQLFEERVERCGYLPRPLIPEYNPSRHGFDGWLGTEQADSRLGLSDPQLLKIIKAAAAVVAEQLVADADGNALDVLHGFLNNDPVDVTAALLRTLPDPVAAIQAILTRHLDPNDWRINRASREGVFSIPLATWHGRRNGPREFLLRTQQQVGEQKLRICYSALATKVELVKEGGVWKAAGVHFLQGPHLYAADPNRTNAEAEERFAEARREVILCGGAFNTPQLLMLSGVGPADHLQKKDVKCLIPLDGVGRNLQDRYEVGVVCEMNQPFQNLRDGAFREPAAGDPPDPLLQQWEATGTGLYATNGAVLAVVRRSRKGLADPDLFMFGLPGTFKGYFVHYADEIERERNRFTWAILKGHTTNTAGSVTLNSNEPRDTPVINFRYFDEASPGWQDDLHAVVEGVNFVRRIMGHPLLTGLVTKNELLPGGDIGGDDNIAEFVKKSAWGHHACGTCRIGHAGESGAVVDGNFLVHGTRNLRVVDASVFPKIPGFFIVSSVYLISEKAADVIVAAARTAATTVEA